MGPKRVKMSRKLAKRLERGDNRRLPDWAGRLHGAEGVDDAGEVAGEFAAVFGVFAGEGELFVEHGEAVGADFGFFGGGVAVGGVGVEEAQEQVHEGGVGADVVGEEFVEMGDEIEFDLEQFGFGFGHACREEALAAEHFKTDMAEAVEVGVGVGDAFDMDFGRHVGGGAEEQGHFFVGAHGAAVINQFYVAEAINHDVGGFEVGVDETHGVEGFESAEDLAQDVEGDAGLDHDAAVFEAEDDVGDALPFGLGGAGAGLFEVGAVEQFAQGDAVDDFHLEVADAVGFLVDFGDDEGGVFDELELGGLGGNAAHVGPVFFGAGVDAGIEELDGVLGDASARSLAHAEEDDALASAAEFAREAVGDGIVDAAGGEDGAIVGHELTAARAEGGGGGGEVAQNGGIVIAGVDVDRLGLVEGEIHDARGFIEYRFIVHASSLPERHFLAISGFVNVEPIMDERRERDFRRRMYPGATAADWADWRWQLRRRARTAAEVARVLALSERERSALAAPEAWRMPLAVTPYMLALLAQEAPDGPLRRTLLPDGREARVAAGELTDPLGEEAHTVAPGLIRSYPHKALLLATGDCAVFCRYCTRARTAKPARGGRGPAVGGEYGPALEWLRRHPEVRDVLVSGGDPLMLSDAKLGRLLRALRAIPHIQLIRIGTKAPAALPQRITPELARMLASVQPVWVSVHFTHPTELTPRAAEACRRLRDAGLPLMNQTVLLKGINDDTATLRQLNEGLLRVGVKPYYLHHGDMAAGTGHLRSTKARGRAILRELSGLVSGYGIPLFMEDPPGGGGKRPI